MQTEKEEPENEKMKILLSFYPEFKITQLSETTARMWLSNEYDLFIDVNSNPGSWTAQRKRGNIRNDLMLRGGRVPKEDVEKADALIRRYQEAVINWVEEVEEREKGGIKKDIEVLKWNKKSRGQAPAQALTDPEESQTQPEKKAQTEQKENPYIIKGLYQQEIEEKEKKDPALADPAESEEEEKEKPIFRAIEDSKDGLVEFDFIRDNSALPDIKDSYMDPEEAKEIIEGLAKIQIPEEALPEEPNLDEIQEAPADQEAEVRILPGPIIPPSVLEKFNSNAIDIGAQVMAAVEKANENLLRAAFPGLRVEGEEEVQTSQPEEKEEEPIKYKIDPNLEYVRFEERPYKKREGAPDIKTLFTDNVIKNMEAVKLQPGENYDTKIKNKFRDIFEALNYEILISKAEGPKDNLRAEHLSKIYEALEVLQLLHDCQARQSLQSQEPDDEKQAQEAAVNEVYINKNSKGYSWRITARAADMKEAVESLIQANERLLTLHSQNK